MTSPIDTFRVEPVYILLKQRLRSMSGGMMLALILGLGACAQTTDTNSQEASMTYIDRQDETGMSMAIALDDAPLAHTTQIFPVGPDGQLVGGENLQQQYDQIMQNLEQMLTAAGAGMNDVVQLRFYVKQDGDAAAVRNLLAETYSESHKPAVSYVVTHLPDPRALLAADAVAVSTSDSSEVTVHRAGDLSGPDKQAHVAVMPRGNKVYLSGQTVPGQMLESTVGVMQSLLATAAYVGLDASDIVQVKAFMHPIADAEAVADTVRSFFREGMAPPFVAVEWHDASYLSYLSLEEEDGPVPIEIEILLSRGTTGPEDTEAVTYSTPPWMNQPEYYSRIAEIHSGRLLYVSSLYGSGDTPRAELDSIYSTLEGILQETGSAFDQLVKGTYYVTNREASEALNNIRTEYYPPFEAPTSSKMPVRGTGKAGTTVSFDMIGVIPE